MSFLRACLAPPLFLQYIVPASFRACDRDRTWPRYNVRGTGISRSTRCCVTLFSLVLEDLRRETNPRFRPIVTPRETQHISLLVALASNGRQEQYRPRHRSDATGAGVPALGRAHPHGGAGEVPRSQPGGQDPEHSGGRGAAYRPVESFGHPQAIKTASVKFELLSCGLFVVLLLETYVACFPSSTGLSCLCGIRLTYYLPFGLMTGKRRCPVGRAVSCRLIV